MDVASLGPSFVSSLRAEFLSELAAVIFSTWCWTLIISLTDYTMEMANGRLLYVFGTTHQKAA